MLDLVSRTGIKMNPEPKNDPLTQNEISPSKLMKQAYERITLTLDKK